MNQQEAVSLIRAEKLEPVTWSADDPKPDSIGIEEFDDGWRTFYVGERGSVDALSIVEFTRLEDALSDLVHRLRLQKRYRELSS